MFIYAVIIFYTFDLLIDSALTVTVILSTFTPDCNVEIAPSSNSWCCFVNHILYSLSCYCQCTVLDFIISDIRDMENLTLAKVKQEANTCMVFNSVIHHKWKKYEMDKYEGAEHYIFTAVIKISFFEILLIYKIV